MIIHTLEDIIHTLEDCNGEYGCSRQTPYSTSLQKIMDHLSAAAIHFSGVAAEASDRFFFNSEFHSLQKIMHDGGACERATWAVVS
jgi:hypothetical protein